MIKIASILAGISGSMFGMPCIYGIWVLATTGKIAYVFGFPSYGDGPFTRYGINNSVPLLIAFLFVCILECVAAWMLWNYDRGGAFISLALLPIEMLFWIGFTLPFGPPLALLRTVLVIMSWSSFAK